MNADEKKLLQIFARLTVEQRLEILDFAEFLAQKQKTFSIDEIPKPDLEPRPAQETVVGAIRRLSRSYPMLDKAKLLNETSVLMTQHIMQGRESEQVIDEIEEIFKRYYEAFVEQIEQSQT